MEASPTEDATVYVICACSALSLPIMHFSVSLIVARLTNVTVAKWTLLYTFISPPLFLDWEYIYRKAAERLSIQQSVAKANIILYACLAAIAMEHCVFCLPMAYLKFIASQRVDRLLEDDFPLLAEEEYSLFVIDLLLFGSLAAFTICIPGLQLILVYVYFWYGHPWSELYDKPV